MVIAPPTSYVNVYQRENHWISDDPIDREKPQMLSDTEKLLTLH